MKRISLLFATLLIAGVASAKDLKTVIFKVEQMVCINCEGKVKRNIAYEKGVTRMKTNLEDKTVTVTFDADKTDVERLQAGFKKFGYKAEVLKVEADSDKKVSKARCSLPSGISPWPFPRPASLGICIPLSVMQMPLLLGGGVVRRYQTWHFVSDNDFFKR